MMAELEIDQSHLPRVQEVCQCFAVLEDGALAHNLQEQEIEQYYSTNVQKNQLVQNDLRVAKRLQDEEEERRAQQRALLSQTSRQLEEQDSEYARMIQEEIQRCAEEARRRELEDEEIAKRIQEEEERRVRQRGGGQQSLSDGALLRPEGACLDLGSLQQVLQDQELARRLQEEEERLLRRSTLPAPSPRAAFPEADFRVAQVAQDEEIARFMQKQEVKSRRRSREMDAPPGSWREPREQPPRRDRRPSRERQVQRERLDSEGLPSHSEDYSPDLPSSPTSTGPQGSPGPASSTSTGPQGCPGPASSTSTGLHVSPGPPSPTSTGPQGSPGPPSPTSTSLHISPGPPSPTSTSLHVSPGPPSPTSTGIPAHPVRNIAEELDPTFRARRQDKDCPRVGQAVPGPAACPSHPVPQSGPLEEPAFVPPTKRPSDKSGRAKPKEKKENCKQQ